MAKSKVHRSRASLVHERRGVPPVTLPLPTDAETIIGRDPSCTIVLESSFSSKRHARLVWTGGSFTIADLGSANGTLIEGHQVHEAQLFDGDVFQIGDETFRVQIEQAVGASDGGASSGARAATGSKGARLLIVALLTLVVLGALLFAVARMLTPPAEKSPAATASTAPAQAQAASPVDIVPLDSPAARAVEQRALAAGGTPVEWLVDEARSHHRVGRLLDAVQLYSGALVRDPRHEQARAELSRVLVEREGKTRDLTASAERSEAAMRWDEALFFLEQVSLLTDRGEPAHRKAIEGAERVRPRTRSFRR